MRVERLRQWSIGVVLAGGVLAGAMAAAAAQEPSSQKLFETGNYGAVAERADSGSPEDRYLAALAHSKAGNSEAATSTMTRLRDEGPDDAWKQIGTSGVAMLQHNDGEAVEAGRRATEMAAENPYAHYQLGLAAAGANDFATSAQAFERAAEIKPDFAYAHYYAGQAFHKQRNMGKAAEHYRRFLELAPESPDRAAIQSIMRTLRG
jgi:tetratricopeptide (TPR) repeat protein